MKISVISSVRNLVASGRADSFRQTLESVRAQRGADVETVVVDGASDDGTDRLIETLDREGMIDRLQSKPDSGTYEGMNRGAVMSSGDLLLFLNSDDFLHDPHGMARVTRCMVSSGAGIDFVAAPVIKIGPGHPPKRWRVSRFYSRLLVTMPFSHQGLVMRRSVFDRLGGFDTRYRIAADYDLILRMFLSGSRGRALRDAFATVREGGLSADRVTAAAEMIAVWKSLPASKGIPEAAWTDHPGPPPELLKALMADHSLPKQVRRIARWQLFRARRRRG